MSCFETLNVYIRDVQESPEANYLKVIANLVSGLTESRNFVLVFAIEPPNHLQQHLEISCRHSGKVAK
jgi:hypothetical protein